MQSPLWQYLPADPQEVGQLQQALQIPVVFATLLVQRGIQGPDAARAFFRLRWQDLHDPYQMRDMAVAVERLQKALQNGEKILLYGDYDVDGTTSVALMHSFLTRFYPHVDYYLPDRDKEGYGVSLAGVEYAREQGCSLVIAMDCGIKAHAAVDLARCHGIDFIVCDHHLPEGELPAAVANLDPKRPDCPYPYKELSGCGIAFKLAQALALQLDTPAEELSDLLDLVAVSTACDIVPMTGENRVLTHFGLQRLNRAPGPGLWALIECSKRPAPLGVSDLVFGLGPLINAAGRLGDAREAVRLLRSADRDSALAQAAQLVRRNQERRQVDHDTAEAAKARFMALDDWQQRKSIVLFDPHWHKGIIGIAAGRMAETFHRPAVILTQSQGRAVGSARSIRGFDLYAALQGCADLFHSFGGHAHAAGMQMPVENLPDFVARFEAIAQAQISAAQQRPVLDISADLDLQDINAEFWQFLRRFEPFGPQNRNPVFRATGVVDSGESRLLSNNHVRLSLRQTGSRAVFKAIGFGLGERFEALRHRPFEIAYNIRQEQWRGQRQLSLEVKDMR